MVRGKLRARTPPVTEELHPRILGEVVSTLFPDGAESGLPLEETAPVPGAVDPGVPQILREELTAAAKRLRANTTPGPDGIPGRAWTLALSARLGRLLNASLSTG